ncbi:MAG: hypothetical protein ACPGUV_03895 [Polyangiales bacterium]
MTKGRHAILLRAPDGRIHPLRRLWWPTLRRLLLVSLWALCGYLGGWLLVMWWAQHSANL